MKKTVFIAILLLLCIAGTAQTHERGVIHRTQSDGRVVSYVTVGMKPNYYAQTLDGYTLWHTETGDIVYATTDATGQMIASTVLAADERTASEKQFLASQPKNLRFRSAPTKAGQLLSGRHFPHTATRQDSIIVILVEFQDVQFANDRETFDSLFNQDDYDGTGSFKKYYYDQSGGRFDPGVRVVGPIQLPQNKAYYNQTSYSTDYLSIMISSAVVATNPSIDYSHFDNDNDGYVDGLLICYAGNRPLSKSEGLWPHQSYYRGTLTADGKTISNHLIFDEGRDAMPVIGTVCHEFGHSLGLPDLYDVAHNGTGQTEARTPGSFNLMDCGDYNGNKLGNLPPNMSILEKSLLGWCAQFDTLNPGQDLTLHALGTANDRGYYLSIDGDEFYAFEVRSGNNHWDAGLNIGNGGMIIYHGKESKLNTTSNDVINCTIGDEGWYVIAANGSPEPEGEWMYTEETYDKRSVVFSDRHSSFTPYSSAKPMKNDSTMVNNIWITNIHWTSDSIMSFNYSTTPPTNTIIDNIRAKATLESLTAYADIITGSSLVSDRGIVKALSAEDCTLESGIVASNTAIATNKIIATIPVTDSDSSFFWRFYATSGGQTYYWPVNHFTFVNPDVDTLWGIDRQSFQIEFLPHWTDTILVDDVLLGLTASPRYYSIATTPTWYVGVVPTAAYKSILLQAEEIFDSIYDPETDQMILDPDTNHWRWLYSPEKPSTFHTLLETFDFVEYKSMKVPIPVVEMGNDSSVVIMLKDRYGKVKIQYIGFTVGTTEANRTGYASFTNWSQFEEEHLYVSDTMMRFSPNEYVDHFYLLYGTVHELSTLGVTDTNSAISYVQSHFTSLPRHTIPAIASEEFDTLVVRPTAYINLPRWTEDSIYDIYAVPYNAAGSRGAVNKINITVRGKAVDILPGGNGDTAWWRIANGEIVWTWIYDVLNYDYDGSCFAGIFPSGTVNNICNSQNLTNNQVLPLLMSSGQIRSYGTYLPQLPEDYYSESHWWAPYGDTITGLVHNSMYEICFWYVNGVGDTLFQSTNFSTGGLPETAPSRVTLLHLANDFNNMMFAFLRTNDATAYFHLLFDEESRLESQGIDDEISARAYSQAHHATLIRYSGQDVQVNFGDGITENHYIFVDNESFLVRGINFNRTIAPDSNYRLYVIPYNLNHEPGYCRHIRFHSPYSDNSDFVNVITMGAMDVTTHSAILQGKITSSGSYAVTHTGFVWYRPNNNIPNYEEIEYDGDSIFAIRLDGLLPNSTYTFKAVCSVLENGIRDGYVGYAELLTFTTESCSVSTVIDTTICYNAYFGGTRYTSSQTLRRTFTAADGCDSLLTVNLNVLPQRLGYDTIKICYGDEYDGNRYYQTTVLNKVIDDENDCDSTLRITIDVMPQITTTVTDTLRGESYTWDDEVITEAGTYRHTYTSVDGCDSTVTLRLVLPSSGEGISDIDGSTFEVHPIAGGIEVNGGEGRIVQVVDAVGRIVAVRRCAEAVERVDLPAGVYLVRCAGLTRKAVVVQ